MSAGKGGVGSLRFEAALLLLAVVLPTAVAWLYFVLFAGQDAVRWIYSLGKVFQFALPLVWWLSLRAQQQPAASPTEVRIRDSTAAERRAGVFLGVAIGLVVTLATLALYYGALRHSIYLEAAAPQIQGKLLDMGVRTPAAYLMLAVFLSAIHSLLEEYYWRWFVFRRLQTFTSWPTALALSSGAFTAHHVVVLAVYFGSHWEATLFFSLAVAVGGGLWAWLYRRSGSLAGPWISHMLVDAAIMFVGYDLVWGAA